jgi:structural maintenance of chromosomes protein 5
LWHIEAESEHAILMKHNRGVLEQKESKKSVVKELKKEEELVRQRCKELKTLLVQSQNDSSPEELDLQRDLNAQHPNLTPADLDAMIESTKARLDLLHEGDGNILSQFDRRAKEIKKYEEKTTTEENELASLQIEMNEKRTRWEPALDALVAETRDAFGYNLGKIGAAGEVAVHKDEDFDQWAIHIRVKFRYVNIHRRKAIN